MFVERERENVDRRGTSLVSMRPYSSLQGPSETLRVRDAKAMRARV